MPRKRPAHRSQQQRKKELTDTGTSDRQAGLVVARFGEELAVENELGEIYRCTSRRKFGAIVCGDKVIWESTHNQYGKILERLPRDTFLARPDDSGGEKAVAANITQLLIISTVKSLETNSYHLNLHLIDHYLVAAESLNITPILVFNKTDLISADELEQLNADTAAYKDIGYTLMQTSTKHEGGLNGLVEQLKDQTSVFVGESGVGKSSIIRGLLPESEIRIGDVSDGTGKGKHTTTTAMLYHLPSGGNLIDSPGVREFGLNKIDGETLAYSFIEFRPFIGQCKFNNCKHDSEPKCAVKAAIHSNISERRYKSYIKLLESIVKPAY